MKGFLTLLVYSCACIEFLFVLSSFNAFSAEDKKELYM